MTNFNSVEKWAKKNPIEAVLTVGAVLMLLACSPSIFKMLAKNAEFRDFTAEQESLADKANEIFEAGCQFVFAQQNPKLATTLTMGRPVIDAARKVPMSAGVRVCGFDGTAGVIGLNQQGEPVVTELYFTGDREVVETEMRRQGFLPPLKQEQKQLKSPNIK